MYGVFSDQLFSRLNSNYNVLVNIGPIARVKVYFYPGSFALLRLLFRRLSRYVTFDSLKSANQSIVSEITLSTNKYQRKLKAIDSTNKSLASASSYASAVHYHFYFEYVRP